MKMPSNPNDQLVFLIGAARSGTKILRDVLQSHSKINAVPYDINFIWRIGNENISHDELTRGHFSLRAHKRINKYIERYREGASVLLEKTVSNTIRVPFLLEHYPNAKFIYLYRNGIDVCESVMRQWHSPNDRGYLLKKLRHVPPRELFTYGFKFALRRLRTQATTYYWGVNYPELSEDLKSYPLDALVAFQWKYCVEKMAADKVQLKDQQLIEIKYEDFVLSPQSTVKGILNFIDPTLNPGELNTDIVTKKNVGKSKSLSSSQRGLINSIIGKTMEQLNYEI